MALEWDAHVELGDPVVHQLFTFLFFLVETPGDWSTKEFLVASLLPSTSWHKVGALDVLQSEVAEFVAHPQLVR